MGKNDISNLLQSAQITLVAAVEAAIGKVPGRAFKASLKEGRGRPVYKVKVMTPEGGVTKVLVDAGTGEVVHVKEDV